MLLLHSIQEGTKLESAPDEGVYDDSLQEKVRISSHILKCIIFIHYSLVFDSLIVIKHMSRIDKKIATLMKVNPKALLL